MSEEAIVPQRLVIVVPTDAVHDSRTLRIAMSLRGRGHRVTIVARQTSSAAALETGPTGIELIRVACDPIDGLPLPAGLRHALRRAVGVRRPTSRAEPASEAPHGRGRMIEAIRQATRFLAIGLTVRSQERSAALVDLGGDLYHGMAFQGIPVALGLARRARSRGIYDIRDIYLDSRNLARLPGPARRVLQGLEARWVRDATATITVNESCAEVIEHRYGIRPVVVMNCPPRADDDGPPRQLVRDAVGLTAADPVVLYHGGLLAGRGLARTIEALADRRLARAHLVFMGWGEEEAHLRQLARGPEVNGRIPSCRRSGRPRSSNGSPPPTSR